MKFEENKLVEKIGVKVGFVMSYSIFSAVLSGIFVLSNKFKGEILYSIDSSLLITLLITVGGVIIKRYLQ